MSTRTFLLPLGGMDESQYYTRSEVDALIADFITNTVDDLVNYYKKSETYTQTEVNTLVGQITSFEVVATLPQSDIKTNVIYLLGPTGSGSDKYDEYIYSNNTWVKIGETSVDLSNYVTTSDLQTALNDYVTTTALQTALADYVTTLELGTVLEDYATVASLSTVATSGNYNDLTNKPTNVSVFTNDAGYITQADVKAYKSFPSGWPTTGTMAQLIAAITADSTAVTGTSYLATVSYSDLPSGLVQAEIKVDVLDVIDGIGKNIDFTLTSSSVSPYMWIYTSAYSAAGQWRSYVPAGTLSTVAYSGDYSDLTNSPTLATVAETGAYSDLTGTPTLATVATSGAYSDLTGTPNLSTVATTGAYSDLSGTPTLATVATTGDYSDLSGTPTLATVATTGDYADLTGTPTIPTVGTGTVTLTQNGATIGTFGLNDTADKTIDIPAGGGSSRNEWYGSQYQFDTLGTYDADTDYYISDPIKYSEISGTPDLSSYATKTEVQTADAALANAVAGKENNIVFLGTAGLPSIGTPLEGVTYAIEGETLPLTFTLDGIGTVTYNFVID